MNTDPTKDTDSTASEPAAEKTAEQTAEQAAKAGTAHPTSGIEPTAGFAAPLRDRIKATMVAESNKIAQAPLPGPRHETQSRASATVDEPGTAPAREEPAAPAERPEEVQSDRPPTDRDTRSPDKRSPHKRGPDKRRRDEGDDDEGPRRTESVAVPRIPVPSRRQPLSADLERQMAAALGDQSLDDLMTTSDRSTTAPVVDLEARLRATVVRMHRDNVFFDLGGPNEGVASLRQFDTPPEIGSQYEVVVAGYNSEDGLYELAIPGASIAIGDWSDVVEGALVEARITGANTGGLECMVNQIRGFIPASQVAMYRVDNLADYVDQKLLCVVTDANPERRNLVLSRRSVLEREKEEARLNLLNSLEEGHVCEGIVRNIRDFGAFVDLGGVDGLIHISQMSWDRVNHPSDLLELGQKVRVRVEKIDRETGKIGLSLRTLQEHPWEKAPQLYPVGSTARGVVTRIAKFGAFVKLGPGVEGLIHISELSHQRVANVSQVVQEGQEVTVKVVSMDAENQRIGLSLKALTAAAAAEAETESEAEAEEAAPAREPSVPRGPLRGGLERGTGGDQFGLKW